MPFLLPILMVLLGLALGAARSRQRLRTRDAFTLASAHRHLPEIAILGPIVLLATLAMILLLRIPRVVWFLPAWIDYWRDLILCVLSGGSFAYLAGIGMHVAFVRRDAERVKLAIACAGILVALGYLQVRGVWPVACQLRHMETPEGYVLQTSVYSCGAASLANVARQLGVPATEQQMARLARTTCTGTSPGQALHALRQVGLKGIKRTATSADLLRLRNPCILLVEYPGMGPDSHAVALLASTNGAFRIVDPLVGPETWSVGRLNSVWLGHTIECEKADKRE